MNEEIPNKEKFLRIKQKIEDSAEFIRDRQQQIRQIVIPWQLYEQLLEEMEDLEDWISAYSTDLDREKMIPQDEK